MEEILLFYIHCQVGKVKCQLPKPIPRWDVHFGVLKTTERTLRLVISPLAANRVGTNSAVLRYVHFTLALV